MSCLIGFHGYALTPLLPSINTPMKGITWNLWRSSTPCQVTAVALKSGCCTPVVRVDCWMRWRKITNLEVASKMEIDNVDELTEEFLYDVVHPKQHAFQQAFAKPCGPAGKKGSKRLIKGPADGEGRLES